MRYDFVTAGEQLAYFVEQYVLAGTPWDKVAQSLLYTGRSEGLRDFFREITTINLTCRIVTAGTSLLKESAGWPARSLNDSSFEKEFRDFIRERLYVRPPLSNDMFRNAVRAVQAAGHDATSKERNAFKNWAERRHPTCYMCCVSLDFDEGDPHRKFSLDHIWPQRFGGDSIEENWLPACASCNGRKKRDYATWAMPSIQSLVLGFNPSEREFTMIDGTHRFAMHYLAARRVATERNTTLKQAFLILTPWREPRLVDESDIGDFFNLVNYRPDLEIP